MQVYYNKIGHILIPTYSMQTKHWNVKGKKTPYFIAPLLQHSQTLELNIEVSFLRSSFCVPNEPKSYAKLSERINE